MTKWGVAKEGVTQPKPNNSKRVKQSARAKKK